MNDRDRTARTGAKIYRMNMRGRYHAAVHEECQDAVFSAEGKGYTICVLADGVSSCMEGAKGARIVVQAAGNILSGRAERFLNFGADDIKKHLLSHVRYELERSVSEEGERPEQVYQRASTLSAVVYDQRSRRLMYLNLGDSLIMMIGTDGYEFLMEPCLYADGTSVTTVTENGIRLAEAGVKDASAEQSVLLCSDGAWREMFENHSMKSEVLQMLKDHNPDSLEEFLRSRKPQDDCSFLFFNTET